MGKWSRLEWSGEKCYCMWFEGSVWKWMSTAVLMVIVWSGGILLWDIVWPVVVFSYRRFRTNYRSTYKRHFSRNIHKKLYTTWKVFQYASKSPFVYILNYQCCSITFSNYILRGWKVLYLACLKLVDFMGMLRQIWAIIIIWVRVVRRSKN